LDAADDSIPLYTGPFGADVADNPFFIPNAAARSLNRARIEALPGIDVDRDILGHSAVELLSAKAWRSLIGQAAGSLALDPTDPDLFFAFNARFDNPATQAEARRLAERMGRRLGYLLLMLIRGDAANRAARSDWDAAHWAYWRAVERVIIGGGLWAGRLGEVGLPAARAVLRESGYSLSLYRSPFGDSLPLIGLARHAPPDTARMLLFDFGHSKVKRGIATYRDGELVEVTARPPLIAFWKVNGPVELALDEARMRWQWMADLIAADWRGLDLSAPRGPVAIGVCLAAHLEAGHPLDTQRGAYSRLAVLALHLATFMRDELVATLGQFCSFALLHDGLAAASAYAGRPRTVVLTFGTAIGAGYVPPELGLRPLAEEFKITHLRDRT
jgi:hypothetical protein